MNKRNAKRQLMDMSNRSVIFYTGISVINTITRTNRIQLDVVTCEVEFRNLSESEIDNYLDKEKPYDCAGSFKSEKLGISLLKKIKGDDPTALIGLPLIKLCEMLRKVGVNVP